MIKQSSLNDSELGFFTNFLHIFYRLTESYIKRTPLSPRLFEVSFLFDFVFLRVTKKTHDESRHGTDSSPFLKVRTTNN